MDRQAAATYYVLYRLAQLGFVASPTSGGRADLMACTADGRRVVLIRVRTYDAGRWNVTPADRHPAGRNIAYAFVDFDSGGTEPRAFVLRGALVQSLLEIDPGFPRGAAAFDAFEDCREAWHGLGLSSRSAPKSESSVSSSPVL
ncbi:MAG TPA: hypothetical protein VF103_15575 [Polyangiaceae bacterium]